jgi:hypothetical protein
MKANTLILMSCLFLVLAQGAGQLKVVKLCVICTTDDTLGQRICSALKEKIRASRSFELVDFKEAQYDPRGFVVRIVSVDAGGLPGVSGVRTALAVVFTIPLEGGSELLQTMYVKDVGKYAVDEAASDLLADIDQHTDFLQH